MALGTPILESHTNAASEADHTSNAFSCDEDDIILAICMVNTNDFTGVPTGGTNIGTFTEIASFSATNHIAAWWAAATGAVTSQTVAMDHSDANFTTLDIVTISGASTTDPFDHADASLPAVSPAAPNEDPITGNTTTVANTVMFSAFRSGTTQNQTEGSGWTKLSGANYLLTQYISLATATSQDATIGTGVNGANGGLVFAVKPAPTFPTNELGLHGIEQGIAV
jgi:hypothetical protein